MSGESNKPRLLRLFRKGLTKTRESFLGSLGRVAVGRGRADPELLEKLEETLLGSDLGVSLTMRLIGHVEGVAQAEKLRGSDRVQACVVQAIRELLAVKLGVHSAKSRMVSKPHVILVVGVNGTGKTTSVGKLAHQHALAGRRVLLVAADTFRAAAVEQLDVWRERAGVDIVKGSTGADPSAVVFDAAQAALARGCDVLIVDTAGRLHTRKNLMDELEKIGRTVSRVIEGAPHEVLLVLDATTGQNAIIQARRFLESAGVTGLILTKLDSTAKGGIVLSILDELELPVCYVGLGEGLEDLQPFDPEVFLQALFEE